MFSVRNSFRNILTCYVILLSCTAATMPAYAEEKPSDASVEKEIPLSNFKAEASTGYRAFSVDGYGGKAGEYESLSSSGVLDFYLDYLTPEQKLKLNGTYLDEDDYNLSGTADYKGKIRLNIDSRNFVHNLDNYDIGPAQAVYDVYSSDGSVVDTKTLVSDAQQRDTGVQHRVKIRNNKANLILKPFNYQAHIRVSGRVFEKEGTKQQRFLDEGCTSGCHKVSRTEEIDWRTEELNIGLDSHLGPVEVEYNHRETRFRDGNDAHLEDFNEIKGGSTFYRYSGVYKHNDYANTKSSSDSIKIHTSMTGKIVGAATYSEGKRENEDVDVRLDFKNSAFDLTFAPRKNLITFLKFRHQEIDEKIPDQVLKQDYTNRTGPDRYFTKASGEVREALDYKKDSIALVATYRASNKRSYRGEIEYTSTDRENTNINQWKPLETWFLPDKTTTTKYKLSAWGRPSKKTKLRGSYTYTDADHPAYASQPTASHEIKLNGDWNISPRSGMTFTASVYREENDDYYRIIIDEREGIFTPVGSTKFKIDREDERDSLLANCWFTPSPVVNLNANYAYFRNKVITDVTLGTDYTASPNIDAGISFITGEYWNQNWFTEMPDTSYKSEINIYSLGATYTPNKRLMLTGTLEQSFSKGSFDMAIVSGQTSVTDTRHHEYSTEGIGGYSSLKYVESKVSLGADYIVNREWSGAVNYIWRDYDDKKDNSLDGTVQTVMVSAVRRW